jgi:hypothetical protein
MTTDPPGSMSCAVAGHRNDPATAADKTVPRSNLRVKFMALIPFCSSSRRFFSSFAAG